MQGYTRRQLKQDRFVETAEGAATWATEHQRTLIMSIGIAVVVILVAVGIYAWQSHQSEQANIALGAAMRTLNTPLRPAGAPAPTGVEAGSSFTSITERAKAAEKQFKDVADHYSMTAPGKIARYMEGVAAEQAGDNATAEKQLKEASDSSNKDVASLAKMALASFYRSSNRPADAIRIYKDLADHPTDTVSKADAQLALADLYSTTDPQQAASLYQQIQKENPQSPAGQTAAAKLSGGKQGQNLSF